MAKRIILFGHGLYDSAPTNVVAKCTLRFYGPYGAFMSRAVARAIIQHSGDLTVGTTRLITNAQYDRVYAQFHGSCLSLDHKLWETAVQNPITADISPGSPVPNLTLLPDEIESAQYKKFDSVKVVGKATPLTVLQEECDVGDILIWAACADTGGKLTPDQRSIILDPAVMNRLYPLSDKEKAHEAEYQKMKAAEQAISESSESFQPTKRKAEDEVPAELQVTLAREFPGGVTDSNIDAVRALARKYGVQPGLLLRFLKKAKVDPGVKPNPTDIDAQNRALQ